MMSSLVAFYGQESVVAPEHYCAEFTSTSYVLRYPNYKWMLDECNAAY